jgi:two-component system, sporulation sensor kinase D
MKKQNIFYKSWTMRAVPAGVAVLLMILLVVFINIIASELIRKEQEMIRTSAALYQSISSSINNSNGGDQQIFNLLEEINSNISFPVITSNENDEPNFPYNINSLNIDIDSSLSRENQQIFMIDKLEKMKSQYDPVLISGPDGKVLMKFYYSTSSLIDFLRYFPVIAFLIIIILALSSYNIFKNIRDNQENLIWVGMSKEAAHQLGTPLSSLLAWLEILKFHTNNSESGKAIKEIENDLQRINIVVERFSKIGSQPSLETLNINEIISELSEYFSTRLPKLGKKIEILLELSDENIFALANRELFTWVIENLIKNAADAIEQKSGLIKINMQTKNEVIIIKIQDNGKGIPNKLQKRVFEPGFSTKKRGWGLGLSLCKRIIEDYHNGKIFVSESKVNLGTTFEIHLKRKL